MMRARCSLQFISRNGVPTITPSTRRGIAAWCARSRYWRRRVVGKAATSPQRRALAKQAGSACQRSYSNSYTRSFARFLIGRHASIRWRSYLNLPRARFDGVHKRRIPLSQRLPSTKESRVEELRIKCRSCVQPSRHSSRLQPVDLLSATNTTVTKVRPERTGMFTMQRNAPSGLLATRVSKGLHSYGSTDER